MTLEQDLLMMIKVSNIRFEFHIDAELFLDGGELDFEDQDADEDHYISDFNMEEKNNPA